MKLFLLAEVMYIAMISDAGEIYAGVNRIVISQGIFLFFLDIVTFQAPKG